MNGSQFELDFSAEETPAETSGPAALSVAEVTRRIAGLLHDDPVLADVWVRGELSRYTRHGSGHHYFTLKDEQAVLSCVMWRAQAARLAFDAKEGMGILAHGRVDLYARRGQYQLIVDELQPDGMGALFLAFEQTRKRLAAEGLFDADRKRPLPIAPRRIALITSRTAAALRDMLYILRREAPIPEIVLVPSLMQGEGAVESVCAAIRRANAHSGADVLLVARGGGSLEDLWTFNEEPVARAIAGSVLPVIAGIGHESDTTLADYAADLRAATPTAAAEIVVAQRQDALADLQDCMSALRHNLSNRLSLARLSLDGLGQRSVLRQLLDSVATRRQWLDDLEQRRVRAARALAGEWRRRFEVLSASLEGLSPLAILRRGYATVIREADGRRVESARQIQPQDRVRLDWSDGHAAAVIETVHPREGA